VPRTEAANQRLRDEQRGAILSAARAVFARRGLAATMAEIATAAGVSQGLAYRYFAGKDELFRALVEEAVQSSDADTPPARPVDRIDQLLSKLIEARREHPELFQLLDRAVSDQSTPADLMEQAERRGRTFVALLRQLIVDGQASGDIAADDPDQLVIAIVACLDGLARFSLHHPEARAHFPAPAIVMRMLRPPAERPNP
jgi:AcrR family transcriptional regulator